MSRFTFRGTGIRWYTVLGTSMGKATVYVDSTLKGTFDQYASSTIYNASRFFGGLSNAVHTIRVIPTGTHRSGAGGSFVAVDRWLVS